MISLKMRIPELDNYCLVKHNHSVIIDGIECDYVTISYLISYKPLVDSFTENDVSVIRSIILRCEMKIEENKFTALTGLRMASATDWCIVIKSSVNDSSGSYFGWIPIKVMKILLDRKGKDEHAGDT